MGALQELLVVQERDTAADRLRHRRQHHPARSALEGIVNRIVEVEARQAEVEARRAEAAGRQEAFENEAATAAVRIKEIDKRMYSGTVSASKDLQAMAAEIEGLSSRRSHLEDRALEVMEELEPIEAEAATLRAERDALDFEAARHRAELVEAELAIDAELDREREAREAAAAGIPADLLATYDRLRAKLGGVGAAQLHGSSCSGCHLVLPATELDRIRKASVDELVFCDQCGRILVHR